MIKIELNFRDSDKIEDKEISWNAHVCAEVMTPKFFEEIGNLVVTLCDLVDYHNPVNVYLTIGMINVRTKHWIPVSKIAGIRVNEPSSNHYRRAAELGGLLAVLINRTCLEHHRNPAKVY